MMSLRKASLYFIVLLLFLSSACAFDCPEYCNCSVVHGIQPYNHAKCTSLEGLRIENAQLPIHTLDLSHNDLQKITVHLEKLRDLVEIDLSYNKLSEIGKLPKRIKSLNLSYNRITSGKLSKIPSYVEKLDLSFNEITYLPLEFKQLLNLKTIELTGNAINCTCDTLEVRNWLQENYVWTDNHILCSYPPDFKGQPWLRVKQSQVCEHPITPVSIALKHETINNEDENDLMLGDQPFSEGSAEKEDNEEIGTDYLPISDIEADRFTEETVMHSDEGSGDDFVNDSVLSESDSSHTHEDNKSEKPDGVDNGKSSVHEGFYEDNDEGSGGDIIYADPRMLTQLGEQNTTDVLNATYAGLDDYGLEDSKQDGNDSSNETTTAPSNVIDGLGIFKVDSDVTESLTTTTTEVLAPPVTESVIIPYKVDVLDAEIPPAHEVSTDKGQEAGEELTDASVQRASIVEGAQNLPPDVDKATTGDNKNTYILLGIVLILLVGLILFVAIKRRRNARNRRTGDAENPRSTELLDMDKKNPGKPVNKNGNTEHVPLITDHNNSDLSKGPNGERKYSPNDVKDSKQQEPLIQDSADNDKDKQIAEPESNNNIPTASELDSKQETPVPAVRQNAPEVHNRSGGYPLPKSKSPSSDDEVFLASTPKPSRYSPVYSPETGRVKIKLTETAKPKTPLLVTRSRSNVGEFVTTAANRPVATKIGAVADHQEHEVPNGQ